MSLLGTHTHAHEVAVATSKAPLSPAERLSLARIKCFYVRRKAHSITVQNVKGQVLRFSLTRPVVEGKPLGQLKRGDELEIEMSYQNLANQNHQMAARRITYLGAGSLPGHRCSHKGSSKSCRG